MTRSVISEKSSGGFSYTHSYDLKDRILYLDIDKAIQLYIRISLPFQIICKMRKAFCLIGIVLSSEIRGVSGERGFAMVVCTVAILLTFTVWVAKIFTLHRQLHPGNWFLIETLIYIFIIGSLFAAVGFLIVFGVVHWAIRNPEWQTMPLLATVFIAAAAITYILDICILYRNRKNRTYIPDVSTYQI